jgi:hypothetical protein
MSPIPVVLWWSRSCPHVVPLSTYSPTSLSSCVPSFSCSPIIVPILMWSHCHCCCPSVVLSFSCGPVVVTVVPILVQSHCHCCCPCVVPLLLLSPSLHSSCHCRCHLSVSSQPPLSSLSLTSSLFCPCPGCSPSLHYSIPRPHVVVLSWL